MDTTNSSDNPQRRADDRKPDATINWEEPGAPAVPLSPAAILGTDEFMVYGRAGNRRVDLEAKLSDALAASMPDPAATSGDAPDLQQLKALALAATPGPWELNLVENGGIKHLCPADAKGVSILTVVDIEGIPFGAVYDDSDANFISAASPAVVLDLIASIERATAPHAGRPQQITLPWGETLRYEARTTGEPGWLLYSRDEKLISGLSRPDVGMIEATISAVLTAPHGSAAPTEAAPEAFLAAELPPAEAVYRVSDVAQRAAAPADAAKSLAGEMVAVINELGLDILRAEIGDVLGAIRKLKAPTQSPENVTMPEEMPDYVGGEIVSHVFREGLNKISGPSKIYRTVREALRKLGAQRAAVAASQAAPVGGEVPSIDSSEFRQKLRTYHDEASYGSLRLADNSIIAYIDGKIRAAASTAQAAPKLADDLAHCRESLRRHSAKLEAVWDDIREVVAKYSGQPCEGEPLDRLDELLARLSVSAEAAQAAPVSGGDLDEREAFEGWVPTGELTEEVMRKLAVEHSASCAAPYSYEFNGEGLKKFVKAIRSVAPVEQGQGAAPVGAGVVPEGWRDLLQRCLAAMKHAVTFGETGRGRPPAQTCMFEIKEVEAILAATPTAATAHPVAADDQVRDQALEEAANIAIKFTAIPRDVLGPATSHMKAYAATGEKIAAAIRAKKSASRTTAHGGAQGDRNA